MFLKLSAPIVGSRDSFRLAKCAATDYPKGKKSTPISVSISDQDIEMQVTGSAPWSTAETFGRNGYIQLENADGKVETFWMSFDAGFDPFAEPLSFTLCDGIGPIANPKRQPAKPIVEAGRIEKFKASYALRAS